MRQDKVHRAALTLAVCVAGLYGSFLSWSILQEKINTKPYGETGDIFKAPLVVNIIQSIFAVIVSFLYGRITTATNPLTVLTKNPPPVAKQIFYRFLLFSITASLSAPIGYKSLKHVDYLLFLLAKSCKLIPVMLVHFVFYKTKFPLYKYVVALSVSLGVALFTIFHPAGDKAKTNDGKTLLGLAQLILSMLLDGLTNSSQDQLFKYQRQVTHKSHIYQVNGSTLMCLLNLFMATLTLLYTVIFKYDSEIQYTLEFVNRNPRLLVDILCFGILGSIGQIFVFIILERFDSIVLTTATVTRKMLSMILSVVLFGHKLTQIQWFGVTLVFFGIGYEAALKIKSKTIVKELEHMEKKNI